MRRRARNERAGKALAPREREVLAHLCRGLSVAQIAARQGVAPETVKTQLHWIYRKLGVRGRWAAAALVAPAERG